MSDLVSSPIVSYTCPYCDADFPSDQALSAHLLTHGCRTSMESRTTQRGRPSIRRRAPSEAPAAYLPRSGRFLPRLTTAKETQPNAVEEAGVGLLATSVALMFMSLGVLVLAFADAGHRAGHAGTYLLFWVGIAGMVLPALWRIAAPKTTREERLLLVIGLALAFYLVKVAYEPTAFDFHDEFSHARNTFNFLLSGRVFGFNPLVKASAYYPGLALATGTLSKLSGLSVFASGTIIIGFAKLSTVVVLFLLIETLTGSSKAAGLACFLYAGNANFLLWSSQFAYESLALPLALVAVYLLLRRAERVRDPRLTAVALAVILAVVVTHHMTAYALTALLAVWALISCVRGRRQPVYKPFLPAAVAAGATLLWLVLAAPVTFKYLLPIASRAGKAGLDLVSGHRKARALFGLNTHQPHWEHYAAIGAVVCLVLLLPFAVRQVGRRHVPAVGRILAWSGFIWIALLPLRLTPDGQETANRSSEFLYVGIALAVGLMLAVWLSSKGTRRRIGVVALVVLVMAGGVAVSWDYRLRLPVDYSSPGVPLDTTPDERAAGAWFLSQYGPGNRVATDLTGDLVFGSEARQHVVSVLGEGAQLWRIFYPTSMTPGVYAEMRSSRVQFIVVQKRLASGPPPGWPLYDSGDPPQLVSRRVPPAALEKFLASPYLQLVYRSSEIDIYAVSPSFLAGAG